ncbi:hypothetical protein C8T65DRAFT_759385, partial [Cerioporus squamosus]
CLDSCRPSQDNRRIGRVSCALTVRTCGPTRAAASALDAPPARKTRPSSRRLSSDRHGPQACVCRNRHGLAMGCRRDEWARADLRKLRRAASCEDVDGRAKSTGGRLLAVAGGMAASPCTDAHSCWLGLEVSRCLAVPRPGQLTLELLEMSFRASTAFACATWSVSGPCATCEASPCPCASCASPSLSRWPVPQRKATSSTMKMRKRPRCRARRA